MNLDGITKEVIVNVVTNNVIQDFNGFDADTAVTKSMNAKLDINSSAEYANISLILNM